MNTKLAHMLALFADQLRADLERDLWARPMIVVSDMQFNQADRNGGAAQEVQAGW